ncbi:type VI secretion system protein TssA [Pseudomonas sp. LRF_L74]|uniref:type VI secretion system protein TssA n=1 Tax=Pseudomonas sp. LRF_L74 TaxID=3369422 RepID=UPI003F5E1E2D
MTGSNDEAAYCQVLVHTAIPGSDYAGEDIRYSTAYERLQAELDKALHPHAESQVDWSAICADSELILREQSKDLRVACWLAWALLQRDGLPGLLLGLGLLNQLCRHHWPDLHPRKMRTRSGAFIWLCSRLDAALAGPLPESTRASLLEQLHLLDSQLRHLLAEQAPLLLPLCRCLENLASSAVTPTAAVHAIRDEGDAHQALRMLQESAATVCQGWLQHSPGDPRALRLQRTLTWLAIDQLPSHDAQGITALRGLPADKLEHLCDLLQRRRHRELLIELEHHLANMPFWLDGQRLAWQCLKALGQEDAMSEIETQLRLFLQRLPKVQHLRFHERTPFADGETLAWIDTCVLNAPAAHPSMKVTAPQLRLEEAWETRQHEAIRLLRKAGLKTAVQHLREGLNDARSERERFHWRLGQVHLCMAARRFDMAYAQLQVLECQLSDLGLARWEPDLALNVLCLLYRCADQLPRNDEIRRHQDAIHRQLCHLDLTVVLD